MKRLMDFIFILLLASVVSNIRAQAPAYSRGFYSSSVSPTSRYSYHHNGGFVPLTYKSDLIPEESKHRVSSSSKYSKKPSYKGYSSDEEDISSERYTSSEYLNEAKHPFASKEHDSHEYTIGTHIRVQHPIPKKSTSSYPTKSSKYTSLSSNGNSYSLDVSHEDRGSESYLPTSSKQYKYTKHYDADPFHVISPPKSKTPSYHQSHSSDSSYSLGQNTNYNVFEPESDSYDNPEVAVKHLKTNLRDRYKGVASKKQIEKYIEDQEKMLDEALKLQLLNSPKFQKLLKTAEKEHEFKEAEYEDEYIANIPPPFRDSFPKGGPSNLKRGRRRPASSEYPRTIKSKPSVLSKPNRKYRQAYVIEV